MVMATASSLLPVAVALLLLPATATAAVMVGEGGTAMMSPVDAEWPVSTAGYAYPFGGEEDDISVGVDEEGGGGRRGLLWKRIHRYYISYGALSANRIPCPPRSGRSYYTNNCHRSHGRANPYTRGCSAITRCRR